MPKFYRLKYGNYRRWEAGASKSYTPGQIVVDLSKEELKEHGKRFSEITQSELDREASRDAELRARVNKRAGETDPDGTVEEDFDWTEVLEGSVEGIKDYIESTLEDPNHVISLMNAESHGANRKGVMVAAEAHLKVLQKSAGR